MKTRSFVVSERERQTLVELLRDGASNDRIADRLGIGYNTVKTYVRELLRKAQVDSRTELVVGVIRGRLIPVTVVMEHGGERLQYLADLES